MAWVIDNGYPYQDTLGGLIEIPSYPSPYGVMTITPNQYPSFRHLELLKFPSEPTPFSTMVQGQAEYPYYVHLKNVDVGAFANATNLKYVRIPKSVKKIGEYAFRNTALLSVTIARDCEYYPTSFPNGCTVSFY